MKGTIKVFYSSVKIFYSSTTEPTILKLYADGIDYLKNTNIKLELIDVTKNLEIAKKDGVFLTPTLIIQMEGKPEQRYIGLIGGFLNIIKTL
ncbi:Uncharacterised protein [Candidatus Tiddalikarchaeum anstoanum]|nr:Uncharacterised protein [Candidatus Tiddalikarchaeum anstoanum]